MEESKDRNFLALSDDNGALSFINLELVRVVDKIRRILWTPVRICGIDGGGAALFIERFGKRAITATGSPLNLPSLTSE